MKFGIVVLPGSNCDHDAQVHPEDAERSEAAEGSLI